MQKDNISKNYIFEFIPLLALSIWIAINALLTINGNHPWKQSEALAQIEAFSYVGKLESPFHSYLSTKIFWDVPIYQYISSILSKFLNLDPLQSARLLNIFLFIPTSIFSYKFLSYFVKINRFAYFLCLSINPLIIHYYSSPLVDILPIYLTSVSIYYISKFKKDTNSFERFFSILLFLFAVIIKPTIPFYGILLLMFFVILKKPEAKMLIIKNLICLSAISFLISLVIQKIRSTYLQTGLQENDLFHLDKTNIFGNLTDRFSLLFFEKIFSRYFIFSGSITSSRIIFGLLILFMFILYFFFKKDSRNIFLIFLLPTIIDWTVFTNRHIELDYYQLYSHFIFSFLIAYVFIQSFQFINSKLIYIFNKNYLSIFPLLLIINLFMISRFDKLSNTSKYHQLSSIEHLLANKNLIVDTYGLEKVENNNPFFGLSTTSNTSIGGVFRSKFLHRTDSQFLSFCESLENNSFISYDEYSGIKFRDKKDKNSRCQDKIKERSKIFISNKEFIFWIFNEDN